MVFFLLGIMVMQIRLARPEDRATLLDIWLRSVRATHGFVSELEVQEMLPQVEHYLASPATEFWVLCTDAGDLMGFMGLGGGKVESMFLAPEYLRQGGGRMLLRHAQRLHGELTVDVNEQNQAACRFYQTCGFEVEGRSEVDEQGRPFPLLHLRLSAQEC